MRPISNQTLKGTFSRVLDLPPTVVLDQATIQLLGDGEAKILNHKGLVQYSTTCIKARSKQGMIEVLGKHLEIASFSSAEIRIIGQIRQVMLK